MLLPARKNTMMTKRELAEHIGTVDDSAVAQAVRRLEKRIQKDSRLVRAFKILQKGSPNCHMSRRGPSDRRSRLPATDLKSKWRVQPGP